MSLFKNYKIVLQKWYYIGDEQGPGEVVAPGDGVLIHGRWGLGVMTPRRSATAGFVAFAGVVSFPISPVVYWDPPHIHYFYVHVYIAEFVYMYLIVK